MSAYLARRCLLMLSLMVVLSVVVFVIIQLPPGNYVSTYAERLQASGNAVDQATLDALNRQYGFDLPLSRQYLRWFVNFLKFDLGRSFEWRKTVAQLLSERVPISVAISLFSLLVTYAIAVPVGIYSATHQYSLGDYLFTGIGFVGLATPNFFLALILMFLAFKVFGVSVIGLFSPQFLDAPWSTAKFLDMLKHLPVPIIVIGTAGTAGLIRVMRGCLLDELQKQYVITARSKGLQERRLLFKYPVRVSINPVVSTVGWSLTYIISGETITSIVLSLPTVGPLLYGALQSQDMYLAGSTIMVLGLLTFVGTLISDILLVVVDPRIRYEKSAAG